jgi:glutaredoxin
MAIFMRRARDESRSSGMSSRQCHCSADSPCAAGRSGGLDSGPRRQLRALKIAMTSTPARSQSAKALFATTWLAMALCLITAPAFAQYKVVQPDGSVTYTDRPQISPNTRIATIGKGGKVASSENELPPELRQAAQKYPVTLYTSKDCAPCDAGRQLLETRGVPFAEKRVATEEDAAALERVVGVKAVPALTVGAQPLRGLSETDWGAYLDAAGYPRDNKLPRGWPKTAATPMVERAAPAVVVAPVRETAPAPRPVEPPASGIRF